MSRFLLLNLEDFELAQDITKTIQPFKPFCICCLDREGPMIDLEKCSHSGFLEPFYQTEPRSLNQVVCIPCHNMLLKINKFQAQVMESCQILLSGTFTDTTSNNKKINRLVVQKVVNNLYLPPHIHGTNEVPVDGEFEANSEHYSIMEQDIQNNSNVDHTFCQEIQNESNMEQNFSQEIQSNSNVEHTFCQEIQNESNMEHNFSQEIQSNSNVDHNFSQEMQKDSNLEHTFCQEMQSDTNMEHNVSPEIQSDSNIEHTFGQEIQGDSNMEQEIAEEIQNNLNLDQTFTQNYQNDSNNLSIKHNFDEGIQDNSNIENDFVNDFRNEQSVEQNFSNELCVNSNMEQTFSDILNGEQINEAENRLNKNVKTALEILERNSQSFVSLSSQLQFLNGEHLCFLETSLLSKEILTDIPLVPAKSPGTDSTNELLNNSKSLEIEIDGSDKMFYGSLDLSPDLIEKDSSVNDVMPGLDTLDDKLQNEVVTKVTNTAKAKKKRSRAECSAHVRRVQLSHSQLDRERVMLAQSLHYLKHKFRCETCLIGFNFKENLEDHRKRKHAPVSAPQVLCEICSQVLPDAGHVAEHNYRHYTRYDCVRCNKRFHSHDEAVQHCSRQCGNAASSAGTGKNPQARLRRKKLKMRPSST